VTRDPWYVDIDTNTTFEQVQGCSGDEKRQLSAEMLVLGEQAMK